MRKKSILIITQTVDDNDSNLSFFCDWLREFSNNLDKVYVIANKVGEYDLPQNVIVLSLGKERGTGKIGKIIKLWAYLLKYLPKVDGIFAHMCPEYVVAGGWLARVYGKKLGLWYLHKSLTWKLLLSEKLVNYIFTAHQDGLLIKSSKVIVTGHGIDLSLFNKKYNKINNNKFNILTVGRITESKNLLFLIKSAIFLQNKFDKKVNFTIVGEPYLPKDKEYLIKIKKYISKQGVENMFEFVGKIQHKEIADYYGRSDVLVNASKTGGVDKAVLESIISGIPAITSNEAFKNILPEAALFELGNYEDFVDKIKNIHSIPLNEVKNKIILENDLKNTIKQIINKLII